MQELEYSILYALQSIDSPILDKCMVFLTHLGDGGYFWIGLGIVLLVLKKHRRTGLQLLMSMLFTFIIGNLILKNLFHRERPFVSHEPLKELIEWPSSYSFPSGHTMNGFAAAFAVFFRNKGLGIPALVLASLIAISRMYLFVHFPTDILGGFLVGFTVAIVVNFILDKMKRA